MITLLKTASVASSSVKASLWVLVVKFGDRLPVEASLVQLNFFFLYSFHNIKQLWKTTMTFQLRTWQEGKGVASQDI